MLELQADIRELNQTLAEREATLRQTEREKTTLIAELTEQNQRLTNQLKEVRILDFILLKNFFLDRFFAVVCKK
jgi:hypothetical protein